MKRTYCRDLPVLPEYHSCTYHRPPTQSEIKFGHGATHYRDFKIEDCCHKGKRIKKAWFVASDDGLRYYR